MALGHVGLARWGGERGGGKFKTPRRPTGLGSPAEGIAVLRKGANRCAANHSVELSRATLHFGKEIESMLPLVMLLTHGH
jgi:hypothetical protein